MSFVYKESYGAQCQHQLSWVCDSGDCGQTVYSEVGDAEEDTSDLGLWCQSEGYILRNSLSDKPYSLRKASEHIVCTNHGKLLNRNDAI